MSDPIDFSSLAPIVLRKRGAKWNNLLLLDKLLTGDLRNIRTKWRVCPLNTRRTIREFESIFLESTFEEFYEWYLGKPSSGENPFCIVPARKDEVVSVYADYQHFAEVFPGMKFPDFDNLIELFGILPDQPVSSPIGPIDYNSDLDSVRAIGSENARIITEVQPDHEKFISLFSPKKLTLWLSTKGAHTPLHYDVYGCNVIMQLKGSKKWQLWQPNRSLSSSSSTPSSSSSPIARGDPSETSTVNSKIIPKLPCLRVPYEESSVYSTYDPRTSSINDVGHTPPSHSFVLEEGDILFIPKHYWHFVETVTDLSLSVNLWLPYPLPQQPSFMLSKTIPEQTDTKKTTGEELNSKVKEKSEEKKLKSADLEKAYNEYIVSDAHSRLLEAATRFVFGALKGSIQNIFDTDDVTAGWINPSEQEGTLNSTWIEPSCGGTENDRDSDRNDYDNDDKNNKDDDDGDNEEEEGEGENMSVAKEINRPEGSKNKAAMHHLAYLAHSLFVAQDLLLEPVEVTNEDNEKSRKERERSRRMKRGGYSNQVIIDVDGEAEESTDEKFGMHNKRFEIFLKRFVNALLKPERIEKCLMESL